MPARYSFFGCNRVEFQDVAMVRGCRPDVVCSCVSSQERIVDVPSRHAGVDRHSLCIVCAFRLGDWSEV